MNKKLLLSDLPPVESENQIHLERYIKFINSRPERELHQRGFCTHHIYPASIAEKNNITDFNGDWNLIELTPKEHFIAHMILFYCGYEEMIEAFWRMTNGNNSGQLKITSKVFERLYIENSKILQSKRWVSKEGTNKFIYDKDIKYYLSSGWVFKRSGKLWDNGKPDRRKGEDNGMFGKTHYSKAREHVSLARKATKGKGAWMNNGIINKNPRDHFSIEKLLSLGFVFGRINKKANTTGGKILINDNNNRTLMIFPEQLDKYLKEGWLKGSIKKPRLGTTLNKKCVNNNIENKFIEIDQISYYISNGWTLGMLKGIK